MVKQRELMQPAEDDHFLTAELGLTPQTQDTTVFLLALALLVSGSLFLLPLNS